MGNQVNGHPDPRDHKITRGGMTPITRIEGRKAKKRYDMMDEEKRSHVDQLLEYEWPGTGK